MAEILRTALAQRATHEVEGPLPLARQTDPPEPFPVAALGPLQSVALAIQAHTRAPIAICAQAVLGAVALVGQAHADVVLPSGQTRPLSLFLLTIAASGERKSAVDALALRAIYEKEEDLRTAYRAQMEEFEIASNIWEMKRVEAKATRRPPKSTRGDAGYDTEADLRALGIGPEPPLTPMLVCPEPTFEGYCKLTAQGQPALGLFSAEGGSFIGGFGMSADHKLKTAAGLSGVWDGEPIKRVRAGDGSIVLAGRRLSMHLMAQPEVASQMLTDDLLISQGLLSRVLIVAPASTAGTRYFEDPPEWARHELARYCDRLVHMLGSPLPLREGTRNELVPRKLVLSEDARRIWVEFHDFVEFRLAADGELVPIPGLANKAAEHAARLAGLLVLWMDLSAEEIDAAAMASGTLMVRHYLTEGLRLRGMAIEHRLLALAQRVIDWLDRQWHEPAIYPAVIYNDCPIREVRDRRLALRIIAVLEEHRWLHRLESGVWIKGALRKEAWRIHGRTL